MMWKVTLCKVLSLALLAPAILGEESSIISDKPVSEHQLASNNHAPQIWVDSRDFKGVQRAAADLSQDFGRVFGVNGTLSHAASLPNTTNATSVIIAGSLGKSEIIDSLVSDGKIDVSEIKGDWEAYTIVFLEAPIEGVPWALVIVGSDERGAIFGIYDISEQIGVSPWYWWADVSPKPISGVWIQNTKKVQPTPSVKYRGFFINDEAPALTGWAEKKFGLTPSGRPFNSEFYKLVFELCLRLRSNYIWPAMWGSSFYVDDPKNGPLANDFGVIIGTSHHEPMARSETEQKNTVQGPWDWGMNKKNITQFFKGGVDRARDWETFFTMGMRGSGDVASPTLTPDQLEDIISVQQSLLKEGLNVSDISEIPQTWVLYKEVGRYYQAGMDVPDSVTLLWTDDNAGNLLRTPLANETDHSAGHGVYYHFDYVGSPRNYKWINTIQLSKTWEQMHLAYEKGAREIWIVNIGDIKPLRKEIPLTHFLDMAYDMSKYATPDSTSEWIRRWATREFGGSVADRTAEILNTYGKLVIRRKYELLSRQPFAYSVAYYDEATQVMQEWSDLLKLAQDTYNSLPQSTRTPFFQMVLHPVLAGSTVVELYIKAALNAWTLRQRRVSADRLANDVRDLFAEDQRITDRYHSMNGGKWDGMMAQPHIGYTTWSDPPSNIMPQVGYHAPANVPKAGIMGVSVQGSNQSSPGDPEPSLLSVDPYMPLSEIRYIDVFARDNGTFSYEVKSNATYVTVSNPNGTITAPGDRSDKRCIVSVDWDAAPAGLSWVGLRVQATNAPGSWPITATLPVNKTSVSGSFSGFVESGGVVAIEAEHYSETQPKNELSYIIIPHYGRTLSGVKLWPVTADSQTTSTGPKLTYSFYNFRSRSNARVMLFLGTTLNHDPSRPLKYAFAIDGGSPVIVQPVPVTPMGSDPAGWSDAVIAGGWTSSTVVNLSNGSHILDLWLLEPGVVIQRLVIDLGGFKQSSLGPPESRQYP
ncbi:hypothetical protein CORC01_11694 [Colletotrichum orchidophilum]|uniref:Gylcosyl hydrolase 115 C-terminal domain-containing protein n=1 Tax=Colletotrichum orchidophilum TaxID=1209926 RepID=A0A1G4AV30_9PEZI|nr:uncharacterized protein CORC01_11694 [Colletotrichum orchidophilum]OHE92971.1 hypothetical protein CORC01_11694 [Colletotrichum orchidophilum]